jgi:hypothetical protein
MEYRAVEQRLDARDLAEQLGEHPGVGVTRGGHTLQPLGTQDRHVDGGRSHQQTLVRADVRGRLVAADVLRSLAADNILGGFDLGLDYPELDPAILVCATELRTEEEMHAYAAKLGRIIATRTQAPSPVTPKL